MVLCALYHHPSDCTQASETIIDKLLTFAVAVREGKYGLRATVKVQSVKRALWHIAQKLVLDGHHNPRKALPAQQQLDLPISWLIKGFQDSDPTAVPKLALPMSAISTISQNYRWNLHLHGGGLGHRGIFLSPVGRRIYIPSPIQGKMHYPFT
jgi:hypothetical protein